MISPIAAPGQAGAVGGMRLFGAGIERGFGFGGVVTALKAVLAVTKPRLTPKPSKGAGKLASFACALLVGASHYSVMVTVPIPANELPVTFDDGL